MSTRVNTVEYRPNPARLGMDPGAWRARYEAAMRWAVPQSFAAVPTTITTSGYAPIAGYVVYVDGRKLGTFTDTRSLTVQWATKPRMLRCHFMECRKWHAPGVIRAELGWHGFCDECVDTFAAACRKLYRRLPDVTREFFCPYCLTMRREPEDRCSGETDGRMRIRCLPCRREDWKRTWRRREARRVRAEARG